MSAPSQILRIFGRLGCWTVSAMMVILLSSCGRSGCLVDCGVYRREYKKMAGTYEIVELKGGHTYRQTFFLNGRQCFTNVGRWEIVSGDGATERREAQEVIVFTDWIPAGSLVHAGEEGGPVNVSLIDRVEETARVVDDGRFALDGDGRGNYLRQTFLASVCR